MKTNDDNDLNGLVDACEAPIHAGRAEWDKKARKLLEAAEKQKPPKNKSFMVASRKMLSDSKYWSDSGFGTVYAMEKLCYLGMCDKQRLSDEEKLIFYKVLYYQLTNRENLCEFYCEKLKKNNGDGHDVQFELSRRAV